LIRAVPGNRHGPFVFARTQIRTKMIPYKRPTVDDLINNVPSVLKSSRQFVAWNPKAGGKKVPLDGDGQSWGNYKDPTCWRTFDDALDLIEDGRAFGIGLALPSPEQIRALPEFNLVSGLVAFDGDAKRCAQAAPFKVPAHISEYVRSANSYSEFSPSLKGLRALIFGNLPTSKQCLEKPFGDGTELSLYHRSWVTLSGLRFGDSPETIEHRQEVIDHFVEELRLDRKAVGTAEACAKKPSSDSVYSAYVKEKFVLDQGRSASEDLIRQFIQGSNRSPKQLEDIIATWELRRGWNRGDTPDNSLYTKRIVEEALWLRRLYGWTLQDVVDIVIEFCKKNHLRWSYGRAKKQIADGLCYISTQTHRSGGGAVGDSVLLIHPHTTPPLTCMSDQIIEGQNQRAESASSPSLANSLALEKANTIRDTFASNSTMRSAEKVSRSFRHKSEARDNVLQTVEQYRGWVKSSTVATKAGMRLEAAKKQLQRLRRTGLVDGDGKGRYRAHRERRQRKLKPCCEKPIPKCRNSDKKRKTLSRTELIKRGWPPKLIDVVLPRPGQDYQEREVPIEHLGRVIQARFYWVSRIIQIETQPWFEGERLASRERPELKAISRLPHI
jgi:hypothetical protein